MFLDKDTYGTMVIPRLNKDPAFGEDYALWCITLIEGRPKKIIQYTWSKNGNHLNESDKYVTEGDSLIIKVYYMFQTKIYIPSIQ